MRVCPLTDLNTFDTDKFISVYLSVLWIRWTYFWFWFSFSNEFKCPAKVFKSQKLEKLFEKYVLLLWWLLSNCACCFRSHLYAYSQWYILLCGGSFHWKWLRVMCVVCYVHSFYVVLCKSFVLKIISGCIEPSFNVAFSLIFGCPSRKQKSIRPVCKSTLWFHFLFFLFCWNDRACDFRED